ncbi:MAG TPA: hypothetical protein VMV29_10385 [Ktedonobacterales bacterium]|nr:hypothetical protein [Ktedonobacterales bacterium]
MSEQISNEQRPFAPEVGDGMAPMPSAASMANDLAIRGASAEVFGEPLNLVSQADHFAVVDNTRYASYSAADSAAAPGGAPGAGMATVADGSAPPADLADLSNLSEGSLPIVKPLDSKHSPALRIARSRPQHPRLSQGPRLTRKTAPLALRPENPPPLLRLRRLLVGIVLLTLAWAGALAVVFITMALINGFPTQPHLSIRLAFYLLGAAGTLWLAVMTLTSIIVGAFSLTLALTTSGW